MLKITDKRECCGCSACVHICPTHCIKFQEDSEGFLYPFVDGTNCVNCGLCKEVCPMRKKHPNRRPIKVFAAKNKDEEVRRLSSSGGIFSAIAEIIIRKGGVVFGVRFDDKWDVVHDKTDILAGINNFRGSKYVQSRNGESYQLIKELLIQDKYVLYSGTPCQVSGLLNYLGKKYEKLITVDFACHGVGSPKIWREWLYSNLDQWGINCPSYISFRYKYPTAKNFSFAIIADNNKTQILKRKQNSYFSGYLNNLFTRPCCFKCPVKKQYRSDFTLADFWGLQYVHPYFEDRKGISAVHVNSEKAFEIFKKCDLNYVETTYEVVKNNNPNYENSAEPSVLSNLFWKLYYKRGISSLNILLNLQNNIDFIFYPFTLIKKVARRINHFLNSQPHENRYINNGV